MGYKKINLSFSMKIVFVFALLCFASQVFALTDTACWKRAYGRGIGLAMTGKNIKCAKGFEEQGGICYSKCPKQAKKKEPMVGMGVVCWDYSVVPCKSVQRKINNKKTCADPKRIPHQALCYLKCPKKTEGVGPVCWSQCSAVDKSLSSCGALCSKKSECAKNTLSAIGDVMTNIVGLVKGVATSVTELDISGAIGAVKDSADGFGNLKICKKV